MLKRLVRTLVGPRHGTAGAAPAAVTATGFVEIAAAAQRRGERGLARSLYLQALQADPQCADALHLLGVLEHQERNHDDAIELIEEAIALQPGQADYRMNCGLAYLARGQTKEAIHMLREALRLRPAYAKAHANLLFALNFSEDATPAEILEAHRDAIRASGFDRAGGATAVPAPGSERLRVGYVSGDFREHVIALFIEPVFANHDRRTFEIFAYDGGNTADEVNARLRKQVDHWRLVGDLDDDGLEAMIRADGIDILVDLAGHTRGSRLGVFARRAAPLQLTYLGYPATVGMEQMDYRISDPQCDPPGMTESHYVERVARLPDSLWCYRPPADAPEVSELPAVANGHITFGSFNQPAKIGPKVIALWARVLQAVPGSHLLMAPVPGGFARTRYCQEFAQHGVDEGRLEFEARLPAAQYQGLRRRVDIALDPFPMNGGSTTCETLWMGVPLITLTGERFSARAGTSLLATAGLAQCIARTGDGYVEVAARMAGDLPGLAALRAGLRGQLRHSPLMDGAGFTRDLESLLRKLWRERCAAPETAKC